MHSEIYGILEHRPISTDYFALSTVALRGIDTVTVVILGVQVCGAPMLCMVPRMTCIVLGAQGHGHCLRKSSELAAQVSFAMHQEPQHQLSTL